MIDLSCECGHIDKTPEALAGGIWSCPLCGRHLQLACAETLPEGAGQGDFDTYLMIVDGPDRVSQRILLGGVASIEVGKGDDRHVRLSGQKVSRHHCALNRVDFGPSRWEVEDRGSTNGTFVNGNRITKQELRPGDTIQVGEYQLQFDLAAVAIPATPVATAMATASYGGGASLPPLPSMPTAKGATKKSPKQTVAPATLAYQREDKKSEGPLPLGECDIHWVMKLRNASTLMVYTIVLGWVSNKLSFVRYAGEIVDMISYAMSLVAAWLLTSPEPGAPMRWAIVRWPLRLAAIGTCAGGIVTGTALIAENENLQMMGMLLLFSMLPQTALFLFYMNRLASRIPNPGLAFLCILLMIATPIFTGMIMWAGYQALSGGGGIGMGLLAILGLIACRIGYIGSLIWFNKSFS